MASHDGLQGERAPRIAGPGCRVGDGTGGAGARRAQAAPRGAARSERGHAPRRHPRDGGSRARIAGASNARARGTTALPRRDVRRGDVHVLLRYVDDPEATMRELTRVLRPGGTLACLEFYRPDDRTLHAGWWAYTRLVMPVVGAVVSPAWRYTAGSSGRASAGSTTGTRSPNRCAGGRRPVCDSADARDVARRRHRDLGGEGRSPCRLSGISGRNDRRSTR